MRNWTSAILSILFAGTAAAGSFVPPQNGGAKPPAAVPSGSPAAAATPPEPATAPAAATVPSPARTAVPAPVTVASPPGAPELPSPAMSNDAPAPPAIVEDPARTPDSPTATAIATTLAENPGPFAKALAEKALASSRLAYGPNDIRTVIPLTNLASVKERSGELVPAMADYHRAIEIAQEAAGPRDTRLFEAWYGIGIASLTAGQFEQATEALGTALQLHRVNRGLYSVPQLDVLHAEAVAATAMGRPQDAVELENRRFDVAERLYGLGNPALAPTYDSVARWKRGNGDVGGAIRMHAYTVEMLEKAWGKDDPRMFPYLVEMARSTALLRMAPDIPQLPAWAQPGSLLNRAQTLAESEKFGGPQERARALVVVGDSFLIAGRHDPAAAVYQKAAAAFTAAGLPAPFDQPALLTLDVPGVATGRKVQPDDGFVLAEFNVDAKGRAQLVHIVQVQPSTLPPTKAAELVTALKRCQLRPRYTNGKPVAVQGVRFRMPVRGDSA